jgi:hypothetical protein
MSYKHYLCGFAYSGIQRILSVLLWFFFVFVLCLVYLLLSFFDWHFDFSRKNLKKGVIRICISKKNRQHNGQKKKYKKTNNDLQNIHIKQKIE